MLSHSWVRQRFLLLFDLSVHFSAMRLDHSENHVVVLYPTKNISTHPLLTSIWVPCTKNLPYLLTPTLYLLRSSPGF